ncbi:amidohydrolase [Pedobacter immunditicola]|uniref:amidohydrolase n=1 Tax=Pedobacter immunditicola TaxID=3133440 RepID=UPI0030AB25C9
MYLYKSKSLKRCASAVFLVTSCFLLPLELKAQAASAAPSAEITAMEKQIQTRAAAVEKKLIGWRRDIHQHPELGDFETRTAALVAKHLKSLGIDVTTGIAHTGVVGILKGGKPGKVVALRADMDALPIKEPAGLPFASKATGQSQGKEVSLMHACGHDAHTAMLMATAEVLSGMKKDIPGTVMFIFQPAEEGSHTPGATTWGAKMMLEEGIFKKNKPDAVFGIHVMMGKSGEIFYKSGATTASSDVLNIVVKGKGGHGGMPWSTLDPVPVAASIVLGLQTVVSRKADLTASPAIVSIGSIQGGSSQNIIPDSVEMTGTIRAYDEKLQKKLHQDITQMVTGTAEGAGETAKVTITPNYPVTINDDGLSSEMLPVLQRVTGNKVSEALLQGASEDFSYYANQVPGLYVFLGVTKKGEDPATAAPNHNPGFFVEESALVVGVRAMSSMALNFLAAPDTEKKASSAAGK